jgi:hypothetical protein
MRFLPYDDSGLLKAACSVEPPPGGRLKLPPSLACLCRSLPQNFSAHKKNQNFFLEASIELLFIRHHKATPNAILAMNDKLRQIVFRSLRLMRGARMTSATEVFGRDSATRVEQCQSISVAAPPAQQNVPFMITVLERINYRLDAIEEKIDLLLVPMEAVKH